MKERIKNTLHIILGTAFTIGILTLMSYILSGVFSGFIFWATKLFCGLFITCAILILSVLGIEKRFFNSEQTNYTIIDIDILKSELEKEIYYKYKLNTEYSEIKETPFEDHIAAINIKEIKSDSPVESDKEILTKEEFVNKESKQDPLLLARSSEQHQDVASTTESIISSDNKDTKEILSASVINNEIIVEKNNKVEEIKTELPQDNKNSEIEKEEKVVAKEIPAAETVIFFANDKKIEEQVTQSKIEKKVSLPKNKRTPKPKIEIKNKEVAKSNMKKDSKATKEKIDEIAEYLNSKGYIVFERFTGDSYNRGKIRFVHKINNIKGVKKILEKFELKNVLLTFIDNENYKTIATFDTIKK